MSTVVTACACQTIGAPKELRQCVEHHAYWHSDRQLASVSSVIKSVFPTDYSAVDPDVLETARIRGSAVDAYFSEYLKTGQVTVEPGERTDVLDRLERLIVWWEQSGMVAKQVQQSVFSLTDGIAGTFDIGTEDKLIDLKNVSQLQPGYMLQLGAYIDYDAQQFPQRDPTILHVTKDKVRLVPYDRKKCRQSWQSAVSWWRTMKELK